MSTIRNFFPRDPAIVGEIFVSRTHLFQVEFRDRSADLTREADDIAVGVRLFASGRVGSAYTTGTDRGALARVVALAHENLKSGDPLFPKGLGTVDVEKVPRNVISCKGDRGFEGVPKEEKVGMARDMESAALSVDTRIKRVRSATYEERKTEAVIQTFEGEVLEGNYQTASLFLLAIAEDKGEAESAWHWDFATAIGKLDPREVGREAAKEALRRLGGRRVPTQRCPLLLTSKVAAEILGILAPSFLGDRALKGLTSLQGRLGESVYSEALTIVDDGSRPGGYATFPFDGEGTATRPTVVVEKGHLTRFLYDRLWGQVAGEGSSGNGMRASLQEPPAPGVTNFYIEPGGVTQEDLMREMGKGFWVGELMGLHTANPISGDFSIGASGHWIEGGKRAHPVRGVAISGNFHRLMADVIKVADDLHFYGGMGSPSLLVAQVDIGGS